MCKEKHLKLHIGTCSRDEKKKKSLKEKAKKKMKISKNSVIFCKFSSKQLLYTEDRLQVAREEIEYLRAYANLDKF